MGKNKSVKKYITLGLIVAFIIGSIIVGSPFNLIDIIIVRPIVNILFMFFNLTRDFGLTIIVFAILVKILMWPLTRKQLKQTKLIRKLQPELVKIRKNCNGNKQLESLQTMDLYKRYNVKPFSSILILFIQLPIFIAIFSAIRVIATPQVNDNLNNRVYNIVAYEGSEIEGLKLKQEKYLADLENKEIAPEDKTEYDFHPLLFGTINMDAKASDILNVNKFSWSAVFVMAMAVSACLAQYFMTKQQMSSGKSEKKKKFRELLKEAKDGKDIDESEISNIATGQMSKMMPIMMFLIMINLHGALAFYYFLSNMLTIAQQKIILSKVKNEMDDATDRATIRELNKIQEAEIIENKKTGTKITRISAKDNKKKRR